ncbi:MAG: propionyl-CoA carboxylase beta chain [Actinomycetota bacterium]|nr:propionyl-CoA carboxylase beta chain [Actinomycetota bacterium]
MPESARTTGQRHPDDRTAARRCLDALLDPGTFVELGGSTDAVVTGHGTVDGRPVCVFAQVATSPARGLGEETVRKIVKVMDLALRIGCPIVGILGSGGEPSPDGIGGLGALGEILLRNVHASGVVPQISLVVGPATGGIVHSLALTDVTVMVDGTSHLVVNAPDVVRTATGEDLDLDRLGGARVHATCSGDAHHLATDEDDAVEFVRELLAYLPGNNLSEPPVLDTPAGIGEDGGDELDVPGSPDLPYDVRTVVGQVLDDGEFLEIQPLFAPNLVIGFGRVEGRSVGVVANQPDHLAGALDIDACEKAARFVRTCDCFNVPVLTLVDVPGFLPDADQERHGIVRHAAKLVYAYAEATTPKVTVITRKAYGSAYAVMASSRLGADVTLAWPAARIAATGTQEAVAVLHRDELDAVARAGGDVDAERFRFVTAYEAAAGPGEAARHGDVDAVIEPSDTRREVARAFRMLRTKRAQLPPKKHGNIPL